MKKIENTSVSDSINSVISEKIEMMKNESFPISKKDNCEKNNNNNYNNTDQLNIKDNTYGFEAKQMEKSHNLFKIYKKIDIRNNKNRQQIIKAIEEKTKGMKSEILNSKLVLKQELLTKNNSLIDSANKSIRSINSLFNDFKLYLKNNPDKIYQLTQIKAKVKENNFKNNKINTIKNNEELSEASNVNRLKYDLNCVKREYNLPILINNSSNIGFSQNTNNIGSQFNFNQALNTLNTNTIGNSNFDINLCKTNINNNQTNFNNNGNTNEISKCQNFFNFDFEFTNNAKTNKPNLILDNKDVICDLKVPRKLSNPYNNCNLQLNNKDREENENDILNNNLLIPNNNTNLTNLFSTPIKKSTNIEMPANILFKKKPEIEINTNKNLLDKNFKSIFQNENISNLVKKEDNLLSKKRKKEENENLEENSENSFEIHSKKYSEKRMDLNTSETISNIPDIPDIDDNLKNNLTDNSDHISEIDKIHLNLYNQEEFSNNDENNKVNVNTYMHKTNNYENNDFEIIEKNVKKEFIDNFNQSIAFDKNHKNSFTVNNDINQFGIEIVNGKLKEFEIKKSTPKTQFNNIKFELNDYKNNPPLFNSINSEKLLELLLKNINFNNNQYIVNNIYLNNDNIRNLDNNYLISSSHNLIQNSNNISNLNNFNNLNNINNSNNINSLNNFNLLNNFNNSNCINTNVKNQIYADNTNLCYYNKNSILPRNIDDNYHNFSNNLINNLRKANNSLNENGTNFQYEVNKDFKNTITKEEIPLFLDCLQLLKDAYNEFEIIIKNEIEEKTFFNIFISEKVGSTNNEKIEKSLYFIINNLNLGKTLFKNEFEELNPMEISINFNNVYPLLKFLTIVIKKVFNLYIDSKYNLINYEKIKSESNLSPINFVDNIKTKNENISICNFTPSNLNSNSNYLISPEETLKSFYINLNLDTNFTNFQQFKNTIIMIKELINSANLKKKYDVYKMSSLTNFEIAERKKRVKNRSLLNENREISDLMKDNKSNDVYKYSIQNNDCSKKNKKNDTNESNSRAKYQMFSAEEKSKAIALSNQIGIKQTSIFMNVPIKSLKRWLLYGPNRLKGGGRKIKDPVMEQQLIEWYNTEVSKGRVIAVEELKDKALSLTKCKEFLASKGWVEKIRKKYNLVFKVVPKAKSVKSEIKNEQMLNSLNSTNKINELENQRSENTKISSYTKTEDNLKNTQYFTEENKDNYMFDNNLYSTDNNNTNSINKVKIESEIIDENTHITNEVFGKIDKIIMASNNNSNMIDKKYNDDKSKNTKIEC